MNKILSFLALFLFSGMLSAQQCGTHPPTQKQYEYTRDILSQVNVSQLKNAGTVCVPMQAHVVTLDDGSSGITYEQLNIGLSFLNEKYYDAGIEFFWSGLPDVANSSDFHDFDETAPDSDTESALKALFTTASDAVNIYFVGSILTSSGFNAAGYAYFPSNTANSNTILMINSATYSEPQGTFTHEFGHYFSLYHTHQSTEFGNTNANAENVPRTGANANCSSSGDLLCDTEADPRYNSGAFDSGTCMDTGGEMDINGVAYTAPVDNIMSYYPDACVTGFTPEQYVRVTQGLVTRQGHSAYSLTASPMTVNAPTGLAAVLNGNALDLSWTDNAANEMGYLVERSSTSASTGFRALLYAATGPNGNSYSDNSLASNTTYYYRVKASNGDCNTYSNVVSYSTGLFYCSPSYFSPCDAGTAVLIDEFIFTGATSNISNIDTDCSANGFGDFTAMSADVVAGNSYNFVVDALSGGGSYFPCLVQIYIDFNQNGSFDDPGEELLGTPGSMSPVYNGSVTIPASALNGTTRMRVRGGDPWNPCNGGSIEACNQCVFGETEDYSLTISGGVDPNVNVDIKVFLEGPYNGTDMDDDLRSLAYIPTAEPYTTLFGHTGDGGSETVAPAVLAVTGSNAIVDWIYVELRDKANSSNVLNTRAALLQRDGDIVDLDGTSSLSFSSAADSYYIAVRHRNHHGVMSTAPLTLSSSVTTVDFTLPATATYGTDARQNLSGVSVLWVGDVNIDGTIKYTGSANDRDIILVQVGGSIPTATFSGYAPSDLNMDGSSKYTGADNDRDLILVNIGGSVPTNTRVEQLP